MYLVEGSIAIMGIVSGLIVFIQFKSGPK